MWRAMTRADVIVVGGGIAGLAVAYHLTSRGVRRVVLLEREPLLASHSSGRNAAIFRPLDSSPDIVTLAKRSHALLDALFESEPDHWLRSTGLLLAAPEATLLTDLAALARDFEVPHEAMGPEEIVALVPLLAGGQALRGLYLPGAGVMDIHAITTRLARVAKAAGAQLLTGMGVRSVRAQRGQVNGVELANGDVVFGDLVVIAGGAWAAQLGASCGAGLPLTPLRRHLVQLESPEKVSDMTPAVWRLGDEVYFRAESGGILASPCDEKPWPAESPSPDQRTIERLAKKLTHLAPALAASAVRHAWACLRTVAPDRALVAGEDPRVRGLFWLAGLGGHGMTIGVAAGEVVAALISGLDHPMAFALTPSRLLATAPPGSMRS